MSHSIYGVSVSTNQFENIKEWKKTLSSWQEKAEAVVLKTNRSYSTAHTQSSFSHPTYLSPIVNIGSGNTHIICDSRSDKTRTPKREKKNERSPAAIFAASIAAGLTLYTAYQTGKGWFGDSENNMKLCKEMKKGYLELKNENSKTDAFLNTVKAQKTISKIQNKRSKDVLGSLIALILTAVASCFLFSLTQLAIFPSIFLLWTVIGVGILYKLGTHSGDEEKFWKQYEIIYKLKNNANDLLQSLIPSALNFNAFPTAPPETQYNQFYSRIYPTISEPPNYDTVFQRDY